MQPSITNRSEAVDALRPIAAIGVVWLHVVQWKSDSFEPGNLGRWAVPYFIVSALFGMMCSFSRRVNQPLTPLNWGEYVWKRFLRLYIPCLIWNVIYGLMRFGKGRLMHLGHDEIYSGIGWFAGGSAVQLWFLTFLFFACSITMPFMVLSLRNTIVRWIVTAASLILGIGLLIYQPTWTPFEDGALQTFLMLSLASLPSLFLGLATVLIIGKVFRSHNYPIAIINFVIGVLLILVEIKIGRRLALETTAGVLLFVGAIYLVPTAWVLWLSRYNLYAMGIYILHPMFMDIFRIALKPLHVQSVLGQQLIVFALSAACSLVVCVLIRKFKTGSKIADFLSI